MAIGQNSYPLLSDVREGAEECHAGEQPCGRSYRSMIVEYGTFERELKTGVTGTFGQQQVMVTNDRFVRLMTRVVAMMPARSITWLAWWTEQLDTPGSCSCYRRYPVAPAQPRIALTALRAETSTP